jgi:serine/threonine protein kinase
MSFRRAAGRYRIGAEIYNHEDCTIYEAVEVATNHQVIIKARIADSEDQINSILEESTIQRGLQHPHICEVLGVYISGSTVNIVLERMKSDLEDEVKIRQRAGQVFSEAEIVEILRQVATALCFAKQRHIAHRNIKPANICVAYDGSYKVGDFGSALQVVSSRNMKHILTGTPIYLSPQLAAGYLATMVSGDSQVEYDPFKADVYALGMTVVYMARGGNLAGLLSFQGKVDVQGHVMELGYNYWLKKLLLGMLQEEEGNRCDIEYVLNCIHSAQYQ